MDEGLTIEQDFLLRRMRDDLRHTSKAALLELLIQAHTRLILQAEEFQAIAAEAGIPIEIGVTSDVAFLFPDPEGELVSVLGRGPSPEEVDRYTEERIEAFQAFHGMDIDFGDIAMEEEGDP